MEGTTSSLVVHLRPRALSQCGFLLGRYGQITYRSNFIRNRTLILAAGSFTLSLTDIGTCSSISWQIEWHPPSHTLTCSASSSFSYKIRSAIGQYVMHMTITCLLTNLTEKPKDHVSKNIYARQIVRLTGRSLNSFNSTNTLNNSRVNIVMMMPRSP